MATQSSDLLTVGKIAQQLGAPGPKVKKAIQSLGLKPQVVKGGCSYYGKDAVAKVKKSLK